jgi:hypothetical protein
MMSDVERRVHASNGNAGGKSDDSHKPATADADPFAS